MKTVTLRFLPWISILLVVTPACGTLANGRAWGADATLRPGWGQVRRAAVDAARDPWTWGPLAGALVFSIDDWDEETSAWARAETPVFGSEERAAGASSDLRAWSRYAMLLTTLATPSGDDFAGWVSAKGKGVLVQAAATSAVGLATTELKGAIGRQRPNESDRRSMPSGHTSSAAASVALAARNIEALPWLPTGARGPLRHTLLSMGLATGWARVEAGEHYPSDVLVGAALGHFLARFVHDAFLGWSPNVQMEATLAPDGESLVLGLTWTR